MYVIRSDGSGKPQPLTQSKNIQVPWSFAPDGKRLAFPRAGFENLIRFVDRAAGERVARDCVPGSRRFSCKPGGRADPFLFS